MLAPDVVLVTDGGGVKEAALRPILGREKVMRFLDGEIDSIGSMLVEDGLVTGIYWVRNPAKLARLDEVVALTR